MRSIEWSQSNDNDNNPDFNVTAFLKSNISKTVCFRDKVAREH